MNTDVLVFLRAFGYTITQSLYNLKIPGTHWSALGFFAGIFLLRIAVKLLFSFFSALSVSGGVSAGSNVAKSARGLSSRTEAESLRRERAAKKG